MVHALGKIRYTPGTTPTKYTYTPVTSGAGRAEKEVAIGLFLSTDRS
jgi:hypothetical protein